MILAPGQRFAGDFEVERLLSQGGMGAVYVARQLSTDKRRALKLMHPQLVPDAKSRERFMNEARIGGRIDSEHVVEVVAAGIDEPSGAPWLAMELLDGEDLASLAARRGPLPPGEVRDVFLQAGHALGRAHEQGIVHRDLKPENLFLARARREGEASVVKVLDFGIAMALPSGGAGVVTTTVGSPFWMAPEQARPGAALTPATDVWALGLIAFQLVSGGSYWRTAKLHDASISAVLTEVLMEPLGLASARAAELGLHALPEGFDAWFARCVDREASARFSDAKTCLAALDELLARVAVRAPVQSSRSAKDIAPQPGLEATLQRATPAPPQGPRALETAAHAASASPQSLRALQTAASAAPASTGDAAASASPQSAHAPAASASASPQSPHAPAASEASASPQSPHAPAASAGSTPPQNLDAPGASPASVSPQNLQTASPQNRAPEGASAASSRDTLPANAGRARWPWLFVGFGALALGTWLVSTQLNGAPTVEPALPPQYASVDAAVVAEVIDAGAPLATLELADAGAPLAALELADAGAPLALEVIDAGPAPAKRPRPVAPATPLVAQRVDGEKCPHRAVTVAEARANTAQLCALLGQWEIARLAGGGSMDGKGYQCKVHATDRRQLGAALCHVAK